ncbi:hypothetical protein [Pedobacter sp. Hv1]|uniref:hypothetical protein n=1 Tax=Pedobacter sp. Hv1 TaxID=1740090 RepID=UPI0006D8B001|nr:hypothetical protein [Pedobacter sp. Hv1]KQB99061.1 hypothetical protein AQF98_19085 [Pedobacter sp. Hv1]
MDILLYLTELLQSRKAIGIVGLGTLYKKKSPGRYDVAQHAFVPPSYALAFTSELKEQEELANFISERRKISVDSANYYISEFVDNIQAQLAEQQEANLEPIGKLIIIDHQLTFIAEQESSFGNEAYGLPTLNELSAENPEEASITTTISSDETADLNSEIPSAIEEEETAAVTKGADTIDSVVEENKLEEENPGQETGEKVEEDELDEQMVYDEITEVTLPVANQESEHQPLEDPIIAEDKEIPVATSATPPPVVNYNYLEDDDDDDDDRRPSRFFRILLKTLIVLILIAVAGALTYFFFPEWFDRKLINNDEVPENAVAILPIDTTLTKTDSLKYADSIAKNNAMIKLVKDSNATDSSKTIIYEVIGSAEKSQKRIDYVINLMKKKGIIAKPLQNVPGRLTKISLGTFTDYNLAKTYQDSLKIKLKNPQIYIQSIKPKN